MPILLHAHNAVSKDGNKIHILQVSWST